MYQGTSWLLLDVTLLFDLSFNDIYIYKTKWILSALLFKEPKSIPFHSNVGTCLILFKFSFQSRCTRYIAVHVYIYEKLTYYCCCAFLFKPVKTYIKPLAKRMNIGLASTAWRQFFFCMFWMVCCPIISFKIVTETIYFA